MPKLPVVKSREMMRVLEKAGFEFIRQKGSHRIYVRDSLGVTLPVHGHDLKAGTLKQILKQAEMSAEEFIRLL